MGEILKGKDKGIHIRQLLNKKKKFSAQSRRIPKSVWKLKNHLGDSSIPIYIQLNLCPPMSCPSSPLSLTLSVAS